MNKKIIRINKKRKQLKILLEINNKKLFNLKTRINLQNKTKKKKTNLIYLKIGKKLNQMD